MANKARRIIWMLMQPINTSLSSLMGVLTLLWGLWVLSPFWQAFESAMLYCKMGEFAPEWAWGLWAVTSGTCLILSAFHRNYKRLVWALGFISWHWFTVSTLMWFSDWQNTGPITYSMITVYSLFCYLNIKLNYVGIDPDTKLNRFALKILRHNH